MAIVTEAVLTISFGEGPHWDVDEQVLYYCNFTDKTINKYNPATRQNIKADIDNILINSIAQYPDTHTSFLIPIEGKKHRFLGGIKRDIVEIEWKGDLEQAVVVRTIAKVDQHRPDNTLNDGKADPRGRLFTGTMGNPDDGDYETMTFPQHGALFRMDSDGQTHRLDERVAGSNGLTWDVNGTAFYHVDSVDCIRKYDYDIETGNVTNCRKFFAPKDHAIKGLCDGLTSDSDGNLWVALYDGAKILKIDGNTGEVLQKVTIPNREVTSLTFGGPNLDILYVTSANTRCKKNEPEWGAALYEVTGLGVKGRLPFKAKIDESLLYF